MASLDPSPSPDRTGRLLDLRTVAIVTVGALVAAALVFFALGGSGDDAAAERVDDDGSLELFSADHPYAAEFLLEDGTRGTLAAFKGRPLVVNFFGSWCAPCIAELPDLQSASETVGDRVTFVGLAVRDRPADAAEIIETTGVEFFWAVDDTFEIATAVRAATTPTTVFFDADGEIVDFHSGTITEERVLEIIEEHFS